MHDPMTVAFEIKYPWAKSKRTLKSGRVSVYRESIVTIWHVDPERGGFDDSCGWSRPHLTDDQRRRLRAFAWNEGRHPYFMRCRSKEWTGTRVEAEALYRALLLHVARYLRIPMSFNEAASEAARAIHNPDCIDAAGRLCFLSGYHTNARRDTADDRERVFFGTIANIARWMLADRRPWWRHPRWHFWHWRIQVHPWQKFRRWAFARCGHCGGRFGWNESPVTYSWSGNGAIYHGGCTADHERSSAADRLISESQHADLGTL